ncbi:hypothetical protein L7F22_064002 [Adiantum nelumboides]|nr:hypothetical protein [Adiantum nelumboides]
MSRKTFDVAKGSNLLACNHIKLFKGDRKSGLCRRRAAVIKDGGILGVMAFILTETEDSFSIVKLLFGGLNSLKRRSWGLLSLIGCGRLHAKARTISSKPEESKFELRVYTNCTFRKRGSLQTLELLKGLASPNVAVESRGCLGCCGMGPNLVVLPIAFSLKQQGIKALESRDSIETEALFSQVIDLQPSGGLHLLYANRSAARLAKQCACSFGAPRWHVML